MTTHSCFLAWRIPGTAEPGGLPSMGSHRVGHDWSDLAAATWRGFLPVNGEEPENVFKTTYVAYHSSVPLGCRCWDRIRGRGNLLGGRMKLGGRRRQGESSMMLQVWHLWWETRKEATVAALRKPQSDNGEPQSRDCPREGSWVRQKGPAPESTPCTVSQCCSGSRVSANWTLTAGSPIKQELTGTPPRATTSPDLPFNTK